MARSKGAVYSGSLKLDRVTGIRPDKGQRMSYVPVKKTPELKKVERSVKSSPNVTPNGEKY